jgi:hypothetical protein
MPTAAEFEAFAAAFEAERQRLSSTADDVVRRRLHEPVAALAPMLRIVEQLDVAVERCRWSADRSGELAVECRRRAAVCRSYSSAWNDFERATAAWERQVRDAAPGEWVPGRPDVPLRPAPWAERG